MSGIDQYRYGYEYNIGDKIGWLVGWLVQFMDVGFGLWGKLGGIGWSWVR